MLLTDESKVSSRGVLREYIYFTIIILFNIMFYGVVFKGNKAIQEFLLKWTNSMQPEQHLPHLANNIQNFFVDISIYIAIYFAFAFISHLFFIGYIKANAIKVSIKQFPEVHAIVEKQARRLGFKKTPMLYLINGNGALNAFATRFAMRNYMVIYSSIFELAYKEGMDAVEFIVGHELAHLKRGHLSFINRFLGFATILVPFLNKAYSRACEYSCDQVGARLSPQGASSGLILLASGTELFKKVDLQTYLNDSMEEEGFATWMYEIFSTHPALNKRIEAIQPD